MNITPKGYTGKEFSKSSMATTREQVDEFLDEIIKQFESLLEENENIIAKMKIETEVATSEAKSGQT